MVILNMSVTVTTVVARNEQEYWSLDHNLLDTFLTIYSSHCVQ